MKLGTHILQKFKDRDVYVCGKCGVQVTLLPSTYGAEHGMAFVWRRPSGLFYAEAEEPPMSCEKFCIDEALK